MKKATRFIGKAVKPELYFNNNEIEHMEQYDYLGNIIRSTQRCNQDICAEITLI